MANFNRRRVVLFVFASTRGVLLLLLLLQVKYSTSYSTPSLACRAERQLCLAAAMRAPIVNSPYSTVQGQKHLVACHCIVCRFLSADKSLILPKHCTFQWAVVLRFNLHEKCCMGNQSEWKGDQQHTRRSAARKTTRVSFC